jgi:hypothetical protein
MQNILFLCRSLETSDSDWGHAPYAIIFSNEFDFQSSKSFHYHPVV